MARLSKARWLNVLRGVALVGCCIAYGGCKQQNDNQSQNSPSVETIRLGAILPLTGSEAKYGKTSRAAIDLAISEINGNADKTGVRFDCVFEDDAMNAGKGVSAAKKLISSDNVRVIIGPMGSTVTLAVAPIAERAKVVLLSPGSSAPGIADTGEFIFRNCLSDKYEGSEMGAFVYEKMALHKVAIYHINNDFGVGLAKVFRESFEAKGGKIVLEEAFDQGSGDHRTALTKIKAASPDGVYLVGYNEMVSVFRQAKELGLKTQWLGTTFLSDQSLVDKMGDDADGAALAAWVYNPESANPKIRNFVTNIRQKTGGQDPDVFSANSYDAVYLIAEAVRLRGKTSDQIREGLLAIKDYDGVTGKTTFESNGDVRKQIEFKSIVRGKLQAYVVPK